MQFDHVCANFMKHDILPVVVSKRMVKQEQCQVQHIQQRKRHLRMCMPHEGFLPDTTDMTTRRCLRSPRANPHGRNTSSLHHSSQTNQHNYKANNHSANSPKGLQALEQSEEILFSSLFTVFPSLVLHVIVMVAFNGSSYFTLSSLFSLALFWGSLPRALSQGV